MSIRDIQKQASYGGKITRALETWRLKHEAATKRKPDGYWHPSAICGCPTAAVYEFLEFPSPGVAFDARLLRIFDTGHSLHGMLQTQFVRAGIVPLIRWPVDILHKSEQADGSTVVSTIPAGTFRPAVEVPIHDDYYKLTGTLDILFELVQLKFVGELKTKHSGSFAKMQTAEPKHIFQAACYHWKALENKWVNHDRACILYYSKDDSQIREFMEPVTDQRIQEIKDKLDLMNNMVANYRTNGTIPSPYYTESSKPPCRTCPWAQACHAAFAREEWINKIKAKEASSEPAIQAPPTEGTSVGASHATAARKPPVRVLPKRG